MIRAEPDYHALAEGYDEIEDRIEEGQADKKNFISHIREQYGRRAANAFKLAMKTRRMGSDKRQEAEEIDAEAARILDILDKPRVARGARTHEGATITRVA